MHPPALVAGEIGLVRSLGQAGIPVYVASYYRDNIALYSKYCKRRLHFSHTSSEAFVDDLVTFGRSVATKMVFFSDDDRAVLTFSRCRDVLEPYYYYNLPDHSVVDAVLDKRKFALLADQLGLQTPKSFMPASIEELDSIARTIGYPCVLKPVHKEDWWHPEFSRIVGPYKKAIQCASKDELVNYFNKVTQINRDVVVQEYISGDDRDLYSVNMYLTRSGELGGYFIGHKIRIYPIHAGVGSLVETVRDDEMLEIALDAARKLQIRGHFNIQFKRDPATKKLRIMEAHTRNSLWCYLATGSGVNITAIAYFDMIGKEYPFSRTMQYGVKWVDLNKDIKALRQYRKTGEWTYRTWLKSLKGKKVFHVRSLRDPLPYFADSWFLMKRRFSRQTKDGAAPHA